jgi:hypothetical protein
MTAERLAVDFPLLLPLAAAIVNSYDTGMTLRQLFYRLVAMGIAKGGLPNTTNAYKALSRNTAIARRDGTFPELIDRTRQIHRYQFWNDVPDALGDAVRTYRLDHTIGQAYQIFIGIEKAGIIEQALSWFGERGFPVLPLGGYCSQSYVDKVRRYVEADGRPAILLYAGDYDASGEDIIRDFVERTACWHQVRHVALTPEQVEEYNLPSVPGKEDDSRKDRFIEKHGEYVQVELDALEPELLHQLFEDAIAGFWDEDAYYAILEREENQRRRFQAFAETWEEK